MATEEIVGLAGVAKEEQEEDDVAKPIYMSEEKHYSLCYVDDRFEQACRRLHLSHAGRLTGSMSC